MNVNSRDITFSYQNSSTGRVSFPMHSQSLSDIQVSQDSFEPAKTESDSGKRQVILSSLNESDREKIRELQEKGQLRITDELPIVGGVVAEVEPGMELKEGILSEGAVKTANASFSLSDDVNGNHFYITGMPREKTSATSYESPIFSDYSIQGENMTVFGDFNAGAGIRGLSSLEEDTMKNAFMEGLGIHKLHEMGFTGKGVGICVIDSGIYQHEDFGNRIVSWKDMSGKDDEKAYDPMGHGTIVSGILAGDGTSSAGEVKGVAPDADLIGVRVTTVSEAIKGIQWAVENKDELGIKIINMSLGDFSIKSVTDDPWVKAAEKAVDSGLIVVVAAGNEGPGEATISTPAIAPQVISVGSLDDKGTPEFEDDTIASDSSRGPTLIDRLEKPDIIAPGVNIASTLAKGSVLDDGGDNLESSYIRRSGSSMATPVISGVCALMLQANPSLTNDQIKAMLYSTAEKLPDLDAFTQGYGRVSPEKAVAAALEERKAC